ncbi:dinB superfamily protein [Mycobacteroides abscessus MAB_082312_2258]|nr:dinB superfamily protein [Mycobacteroides abscessus MAB_082312_2258]
MSREELARDLEAARMRTLTITDHDDAELHRQYDPLMSPLVWDLAHIGQQEELWLLRGGDPRRPGMLPDEIESLYDAFRHTRASRVQLPLLSPAQARAFCHEVRGRVLDRLEALPSDGSARAEEFVYAMVLSHEHQHDETMMQALSIRHGAALLEAVDPLPPGGPVSREPRCWYRRGRSCWASTPLTSRSRWTTNGRHMWCISRVSASARSR